MSILYDWAGSVIGQPLNPDGHYGNQCVDTIDHFGEFIFGVPWQQCVGGVTGAKDLLDVAPDEYWERIDYYHGFVPQQFDVLVYGGDNLNQWGHTAVTWWADPNAATINVIQQDGFAYPWQFVDGNYYSAKPAHYYTLHYSQAGTGALKGVLRPRANKLIGGGAIGPAGEVITTPPQPQEDELSAAEVKQIKDHINDVFLGTYAWDGRLDNPGLGKVIIENQKRITTSLDINKRLLALVEALPTNVWWNVTVEREDADGNKYQVPALQELANIGTHQGKDSQVLLQIAGRPAEQVAVEMEKVFSELANRINPDEEAEGEPNG